MGLQRFGPKVPSELRKRCKRCDEEASQDDGWEHFLERQDFQEYEKVKNRRSRADPGGTAAGAKDDGYEKQRKRGRKNPRLAGSRLHHFEKQKREREYQELRRHIDMAHRKS